MNPKKLLWLLPLLLILSGLGCQRSKAGITVAGSTSVEPFAELLAEEYIFRHPESHIYVQGGGSTAGIEAVMSRTANIGMCSRPLMGKEKNLYAVTVAKDAIAIILHPQNPIQDLSLDQIRGISFEPGSFVRIGRSFKICNGQEDILEVWSGFNGASARSWRATIIPSDIFIDLVNNQVKALKISYGTQYDYIDNGRYTLVRPFLFVFNEEPIGEAKSFLEFVLSPLAQKLLLKEGLVPVLPKLAQK
jgi:phosphate transport system substrate-binding protein